MKYHSIEAQSKFYVQRVANIANVTHNGGSDKGRLLYCETNERLYKGENSAWRKLATLYDIIPQNTKVLMGAYPLPDGWNIITNQGLTDRIILLTNTISEVSTSGGSWTIDSMENAGSHRHITGYPTTTISIGKSELVGYASSSIHRHYTDYSDEHQHTFDGTWRPPTVKYCVAIYT